MGQVSIIMPNYNGSKYISQAIESVLTQTYKNWELIIIDDCSTDNSLQIIDTYVKRDARIKLIKMERNSGPAIARNTGIEYANGRYIAFLDNDDIWLEHKLEKQISFMQKHKVGLCYSSYYVIDELGKTITKFKIPKDKVSYRELLKSCIIGNLTAIYDTKILGKVFMENVGHEDYTLWLKILKRIDYAYGLKEFLAKYRVGNNSISRNKLRSAFWQWNIYRNIERLSFLEGLYYFFFYAWNGLNKYRKI